MWLNIIAVIVLVLFFSYFLKIKINVSDKKEKKDDKNDEEKLPSSSSQARYEESRYAFLKFAEFVLLKKRPFGLNNMDDDAKGTISGDSRGNQGAGSSGGCRNICLNDPECNAWQYSSNEGKCQKYNINRREQIKTTNSGDNIGYIFRPKDSDWAVQDLSGLPTEAKFFKAVANTVLRLNCKIEKLRNKAIQVMSTSNVKYCYEKEVTSGNPDDYLRERDDAISLLEDATQFFIFSGDNAEFPEQIECSLYFSIIVDNIKNLLFESNNNLKAGTIKAANKLKPHYSSFVTVRDFFDSRLDKNYNSSIDRAELTDVFEKALKSGQGIAMDIIDSELSLEMDDCRNEESIQGLVEMFFSKYDTNGDGLVHLHELLASRGIPRPSYEGGMCSSGRTSRTRTSRTASSASSASSSSSSSSGGGSSSSSGGGGGSSSSSGGGGGNGNTKCNIHSEPLPDWLKRSCGGVNEVPGQVRERFKKKGADHNDGYWGMKDACLKTREVSGGKQYGCVWNSDAFELGSGSEGRDVEKGLAELSDPYDEGPCQRGDVCSSIELKSD